MNINITDQIVSDLLSGVMTVLVLILVGSALSVALRKMARNFPFTRMALVLALAPMCLVRFLDYGENSTLYLFAMIATLLGITIDGINHLLTPKEASRAVPAEAVEEAVKEETPSKPGVIVWEKAE